MRKKGAMELSIGTIVILVLAMTMLFLGLLLVRNIFKGATESVDIINDQVQDEIKNIFVNEEDKIVVKLGSDKTASIKADTQNFGLVFGARTIDGATVDINQMKYKLSLDDSARENCITMLNLRRVEELFNQRIGSWLEFDSFQGDTAFARIEIDIPDGTPLCTQKVHIDVKDGDAEVGRDFFTIEVIRKGFF